MSQSPCLAADAAAALADLLEGCASMAMMAAMDPQQMAEQWRNLAIFGFNDTEIASMRSATEESMRRCSAFSPRSDEAWRGLMTAARARAAALGHPGALLRQQRPRGPADSPAVLQADERARRAGVELLQQGEPMDLMRYAPHLASHSPYDTEGYLLAASTLLDGCMRDPRAYAMTTRLGPGGAIAVTTVLFTLAHFPADLAALAQGLVTRALLGAARERTGSLVAPILLHAALNARALVLLSVLPPP